jgi:tetratricopeptide (TPR) repeat protein/Mg-chelatase subunit ChlD
VSVELAQPLWLWALLVLPLLAAAEWWAVRQDRDRTARLVARSMWSRVVRRPAEAWRFVRLGLLLLGAAGIVTALAGPRWGLVREKLEREGVDVVLVADTSASMNVEDVQPNRFFVARAGMASLLERLSGDRFALVALEGEAYPLVPLTLDADAVGLFLDTMEPGIVPTPGTSLGAGLAKALDMFVDKGRSNKVIVLASDGEDLEGDIDDAVKRAKDAGVVVHTLGVGTESGAPVPDFDKDGNRSGYKKDESGTTVVSRLNEANLKAIARATGGQYARLTPTNPSAWQIASAIEGMEQRTLAQEYSYRKKERYQWPLAVGLLAVTVGLLLPPPRLRWRRTSATAVGKRGLRPGAPGLAASLALMVLAATSVSAQESKKATGSVVDEVLLRPQRLTSQGRKAYDAGDYPKAQDRFDAAAGVRPGDPRATFNQADALFKAGKLDEAAELYRALGSDEKSPLAGVARYNLGNTLLQKQSYPDAVKAYRDALRLLPGDADTRRNLEIALRAIKEQEQQKQDQKQDQKKDDQKKDDQKKDDSKQQEQQKKQQQQQQGQQQRPKTEEEKDQERWKNETGMPKERAMQLLAALQQNEKEEQKKQLALLRAGKKKGKDW